MIGVLNAADAQGRNNEEAATIIREKETFEYFPHPILRRKAFRNAAACCHLEAAGIQHDLADGSKSDVRRRLCIQQNRIANQSNRRAGEKK